MPNLIPSGSSDEFAQIVAEARAASVVLAETINQQNEVFLSACNSIIAQTLNASKSLNDMAMEMAKDSATKKVAAAKEKASKKVAEAANTAQKATSQNGSDKSKTSGKNSTSVQHSPEPSLATGFVDAMLISMQNSVQNQQSLLIMAQAATTQTVAQILSMDAAALSVSVANIIDHNK